jgi:hypothetical protein
VSKVPDPLEESLTDLYGRVPPPPHDLEPGRERFLDEAARLRSVAGRPAVTPTRWRRLWLRPAFRFATVALVAILALSALGGGLVRLSEASLPGEWLYPLKLATEDLRLSLTRDPVTGTEQHLNSAAERVDEMRGLAEQGSAIPDELVDRMVQQLERAMQSTTAASPEEAPVLMEQFRRSMSLQHQVLVQIQKTGPDGDQPSVRTALRVTQRAYEIVEEAEGDPKRFQEEWLQQIQPETPMEGQLQYQNENQHQRQGQDQDENPSENPSDNPGEDENPSQNQNPTQPPQTEPAGARGDDQIGPPPAPTAEPLPESGTQSQSGRSIVPRLVLTPLPGKKGR